MSQLSSSPPARGSKVEALNNYCRLQSLAAPVWQVVSDRRGGRTAWSCIATVDGRNYHARYWYDGQYVQNASEDVAEVALQQLGLLPPLHQQQQQQDPQGRMQQQSSSSSSSSGRQGGFPHDPTRSRNGTR